MTQTVEATPASSDLVIVAEQNQLPADSQRNLLDSFSPHYLAAQALIDQAKAITVTDATQLSEMKQARKLRLELREVRVTVDKVRKALKEDSLRTGKAIDGMANVLKFMIEPVEQRLEEAEKFAERAEAERKAKLKAAREELLRPFGVDSSFYDLANMPEQTFAQLLDTSRLAHESRIAAAKKAEEDRIAAEQARIAEEKRVREENERLRREAEEREKAMAAERAKAEAERRAIEEKARQEREAAKRKAEAERKEAEAKAAAERAELERKAAAERAERLRLEAEAKAKADAEAKRQREEAAAKAKAQRAPDKKKVAAFAEQISKIELPECTTEEGRIAVSHIQLRIAALVTEVQALADKL